MAVSTRRTNGSPSLSPRPPPIRTARTSTRLTAEAMAAPRASMARSISSWASGRRRRGPPSRPRWSSGAALALLDGQQLGRAAGGRGRPGCALQGDLADVGLHAAAAAAGAQLAAVDHHHVADLAGITRGAGPQPPPRTRAPPTPDPAKTVSRSSKPRLPRGRVGQGGHDHVVVDHHPLDLSAATIAPRGTRSPPPKTLAAPNSSPVAASTRPGADPDPGQLACGATLASLAAALTTVAIFATTAAAPSPTGSCPGLAEPGARRRRRSRPGPWSRRGRPLPYA